MTPSEVPEQQSWATVVSLAEVRARRQGTAGTADADAAAVPGNEPPTAAPTAKATPSARHGAAPKSPSAFPAPRGQKRASNVAIHQLARRGMSRWELAQVLERRGVDEQAATAELDRLESLGLVDDAALAVTIVRTHHSRKGRGRTALRHELKRRHIESALVEEALSELHEDEERERAFALASQRVRRLSGLDEPTVKRRLAGFLARKGYESEVVWSAVDAALTEHRPARRAVRFE